MAENYTYFLIFLIGTIIVDLFFRFGISQYLKKPSLYISLKYVLAQKTQFFISKIIYITGVFLAFSSLDLQESLLLNIKSIYTILMFITFGWLAFRVVNCFGCFFSEKFVNDEKSSIIYAVSLMTRTLNTILGIFLFIILLQKLGYNTTPLLIGIGIFTLLIGLSAQKFISDILSFFKIVLNNIFKIDDFIEINNLLDEKTTKGKVVDISLFSTKLHTPDDTIVTISNHKIIETAVKNTSNRQKFQLDEFISLTYDMEISQIERAVAICREVLKNHPQVENNPNVYFNDFGETSLKIIVQAYATTSDHIEYLEIREEILMGIKKAFDAERIDFAVNHVPGF